MALIHYTPELHSALQDVAELSVGHTGGHDGHYVWMLGGEVMPPELGALEDLYYARLIAFETSPRLAWSQPARVLLTLDGSDRLAAWNREHRDGAA